MALSEAIMTKRVNYGQTVILLSAIREQISKVKKQSELLNSSKFVIKTANSVYS